MKKWIKEFGLSLEVIEYACEKTVLNTGKAAFGYANKVLLNWKEENVKSVEEAVELENRFNQGKKENDKTQNSSNKVQKRNKFVNFEQRDYDFETYERMEIERIDKKIQ